MIKKGPKSDKKKTFSYTKEYTSWKVQKELSKKFGSLRSPHPPFPSGTSGDFGEC